VTAAWSDLGKREGLSWQDEGVCNQTDPEAFFPEKGGSTRDAKRVCIACPVRDLCLDYALATNQTYGVWGGLAGTELRRLRSRRAAATTTTARTAKD
jgi:WhiB family redox-sensing transcriptional regulator